MQTDKLQQHDAKLKVQESKSNRNNNQVTHKFLCFFLNVNVFIIVLSLSLYEW